MHAKMRAFGLYIPNLLSPPRDKGVGQEVAAFAYNLGGAVLRVAL